jgi:hypothetical protein
LLTFRQLSKSLTLRYPRLGVVLACQHTVHASMTPSPTTDDSESQTLSKLHLHIVPDDKPVFACHKCSEVVVS